VFWCAECEAVKFVEESFKALQTKLHFIAYLISIDIPKYSVTSFIKIQPLLIKLCYFE